MYCVALALILGPPGNSRTSCHVTSATSHDILFFFGCFSCESASAVFDDCGACVNGKLLRRMMFRVQKIIYFSNFLGHYVQW